MNIFAWVADPVSTKGLTISPTDSGFYMVVILLVSLFFFSLLLRK